MNEEIAAIMKAVDTLRQGMVGAVSVLSASSDKTIALIEKQQKTIELAGVRIDALVSRIAALENRVGGMARGEGGLH